MRTAKITNSDGFEMTVQVVDDEDGPAKPEPATDATTKARQPANKARASARNKS